MNPNATARFTSVPGGRDVGEGEARVFDVNGVRVVLARVDGELFAVADTCSHDDGPLGEGALEGHQIVCPRHGARFDVRSGAVLSMPAPTGIRSFPVRVRDGEVEVDLENVR